MSRPSDNGRARTLAVLWSIAPVMIAAALRLGPERPAAPPAALALTTEPAPPQPLRPDAPARRMH